MSYLAMGLAFAAIGFVVANAVLTLLTAILWPMVRHRLSRARSIFLVRMLPSIGSAVFVLACVLPAFWTFEPHGTSERPGPALAIVAALAAALVVAGLRRTLVSWLHVRRLERAWKTVAVHGARLGDGAYRVPSELPFAALVGVVRPRLFVSDRFFAALTAGERQAVLDHEAAHRRSLDNLKRVVMRLAPDWLAFVPIGREIERAWAVAAEEEADDHAASLGRIRSLDLAGALLKAARSTPVSYALASSFCDEASIASRVARLLNDPPARRAPSRFPALRFVWIVALLGAAAVLSEQALWTSYRATEAAIRLLQ